MSAPLLDLLAVGAAGFFGAFVGAVAGGGVTVVLLPVLVLQVGIHQAVPITTLALVAATTSRIVVYRREIVLPVVWWFSAGSVPLTVTGTYLFTVAPPDLLTRLLGGFLLVAVVWRRLRPRPPAPFHPAWFLPLGAAFGFLTGITAAVGTLLAPFFLGYGLRKRSYVGTVGFGLLLIQAAKLAVFGGTDFLLPPVLVKGAFLLPFMVAGTLVGRKLLDRLPERAFVLLLELVMVTAGLNFVLRGA